jgi:hypothetical protein
VDKLSGKLPFLALGALGVANLVAAVGALWDAHRTEELGEGRFELLRDQHDRLELLHEERRVLLDERERERRERLEAQKRVKQLMREPPAPGARARTPAPHGGAGIGARGTYAQSLRTSALG